MKLIEAVKSGDRFYRCSWLDKTPIGFEDLYKLSKEAFLAKDWEIEQGEIRPSEEKRLDHLVPMTGTYFLGGKL